jgi:hypothetical protein
MKHRLSLSLFLALFVAIGSPFAFAAEVDASPTLEKIITEAKAAFDLARDLDHANQVDPVAFSIEAEAGPVELAFLPIEPAPAKIEEATCDVPRASVSSGHRIHAWLALIPMPASAVSNNAIGLIWRGPRNYDRLA